MKALVCAPICPLMLHPSRQCALADEVLCGDWVEVLEQTRTGWYLVRTSYRYTGYAPAEGLLFGEGNAERWAGLPKLVVTRSFADVLAAPAVQGFCLETLPRGALVSPVGGPDRNGWQKLSLCDGREGYAKAGLLDACRARTDLGDEAALRRAVVCSAMSYLGTQYRWGGKSPLGIDCSGLTAMAYLLNGVVIYRDAAIREGFPVREIPRQDMKPADLIFFPGHVAMYLGEGRYLHSTAQTGSDGVVINSLDPADPGYRADLPGQITAVGSIF